MNQKYLMGMAAEGGQAVVFEAKASNVAAFICQNRAAPELLICTLVFDSTYGNGRCVPGTEISGAGVAACTCANANGAGTGYAAGDCAARERAG